jgi:hypothetical protein
MSVATVVATTLIATVQCASVANGALPSFTVTAPSSAAENRARRRARHAKHAAAPADPARRAAATRDERRDQREQQHRGEIPVRDLDDQVGRSSGGNQRP